MAAKLIRTNEEAIDCLRKNKPTSGYQMLQESVDMGIEALEKIEKIEKVVNIFDSIDGATFDDYEDLVDDLYTILGK